MSEPRSWRHRAPLLAAWMEDYRERPPLDRPAWDDWMDAVEDTAEWRLALLGDAMDDFVTGLAAPLRRLLTVLTAIAGRWPFNR